MRGDKTLSLVLALLAAIVVETTASAHRRDEHLMAARIAVEPDRVDLELDLTPGIAVADATIAGIDRDGDGELSANEKRDFVGQMLDAVVLELDGLPLHVQQVESTFPGLDAIRLGEGTIQLRSTVRLPRQATGEHQLLFRNTYSPDASVYLANALVPVSDRVEIRTQHRDASQQNLTVDYVLRSNPAVSPASVAGFLIAVMISSFYVARRYSVNESQWVAVRIMSGLPWLPRQRPTRHERNTRLEAPRTSRS